MGYNRYTDVAHILQKEISSGILMNIIAEALILLFAQTDLIIGGHFDQRHLKYG